MQSTADPTKRNVDDLDTEAEELEIQAARIAARARTLREKARALRVRAAHPAPVADPEPLLSAAQIAKRLGISVSTIRRLDPPHVVVGDASTRRYDLAAVRAWLAAREPAPTTPTKRESDVDVSSTLRAASMRRAAS